MGSKLAPTCLFKLNANCKLAVALVVILQAVGATAQQGRLIDDCATTTMRVMRSTRLMGAAVYKSQRLPAGSGTLDCLNLCKGEEDCWSFSYEKNRKMCYLHSTEESEITKQRSGAWTSGFRVCVLDTGKEIWGNPVKDFRVLECLTGTVPNESNTECVCAPGWGYDGSSCSPCGVDYFKATAGNVACDPCGSIYYYPYGNFQTYTYGQTGATSCGCFPAYSTARLEDGTHKTMKDLEVGDVVAAVKETGGQVVYSPIYMFFHRQLNARAKFIKFHLEGNNATLTVTPNHFVYRSKASTTFNNAELVHAASVGVGDFMFARAGNSKAKAAMVVRKEHTTEKGMFSPYTLEGSILVDDVAAHSTADYILPNGQFLSNYYGLSAKAYFMSSAPIRVLYRMGLGHIAPVNMIQRFLTASGRVLMSIARYLEKMSS